MRFTRPAVRDLLYSPDGFVASRLAGDGTGFHDLHRRALAEALSAYFEAGRDARAIAGALDRFIHIGNGPSPGKEQIAATMTRLTEKFVTWDQRDRASVWPVVDAANFEVPWRSHRLAIPRDLVLLGPPRVLRIVWTDHESGFRRRGTGAVVAACLAHAEAALDMEFGAVEVWHLREPEIHRWPRSELVRHWDALDVWLRWASERLRAA